MTVMSDIDVPLVAEHPHTHWPIFSILWSIESFYLNHYLLHYETSLMRSLSTALIYQYWDMNLERSLIVYQFTRVTVVMAPCGLHSHRFLARFTVLDWRFLPWSGPQTQPESGGLHLKHSCHYCTHGHILPFLVIIEAHRVHTWVWLLIFTFPPSSLPSISSRRRATQQRGSFLVRTDLISSCPVANVCRVFH